MFQRILCAIDGSPISAKVIETAKDLALKGRGAVVLFHAYHIPDEYIGLAKHYATSGHFLDELKEKLENEHRPVVEKAAATLQQAGVTVEVQLKEHEPGSAIVEATEKNRCDSVILGSHGKGGVRRFLLGSVTDYVVHHANVPVIVVKA